VTQVDVRPTELSYSGLQPGDEATATDEANNYSAIEVENIGSSTIQEVWAETSQITTDPFATGSASNYDAGNFVSLSTASATSSTYSGESWQTAVASSTSEYFHYVNRIEFVDTPAPTYIDTTTDSDAVNFGLNGNLVSNVGRFREGDKWYFYTIYHDDDSANCQDSAELWVGTDPHTPTTLGTTDFTNATSNAEVDRYSISPANDNVGVADSGVNLNANLTYPDVYTYCNTGDVDSGYTARSRFNTDPDLDPNSANITESSSSTTPIFDASASGETLDPGAHFPVDVTVQLPQGVVDEDITGGTLTLLAQAGSP
jgi:hypothetical protein